MDIRNFGKEMDSLLQQLESEFSIANGNCQFTGNTRPQLASKVSDILREHAKNSKLTGAPLLFEILFSLVDNLCQIGKQMIATNSDDLDLALTQFVVSIVQSHIQDLTGREFFIDINKIEDMIMDDLEEIDSIFDDEEDDEEPPFPHNED